jgi:hypothetical protein
MWAQEESRVQETPSPRKTPRSVPKVKPQPQQEEVIVMETLSGRVVNKQGEGAANLRIWFVDKATGKVLGETRTDNEGNFALAIPRTDTLIIRMSREGKEFMEKEYPLSDLLQSEVELLFAP